MFMLSKLLLREPKSAPVVLVIDVMRRLPLKFEEDDQVRLPSDWHRKSEDREKVKIGENGGLRTKVPAPASGLLQDGGTWRNRRAGMRAHAPPAKRIRCTTSHYMQTVHLRESLSTNFW
jgi:hypothetical protein